VVGVTREAQFGAVAMVGLGGVLTDLIRDRSFGLLPVTDRGAASLLRSLRVSPMFAGFRGAEPVDVAALEDLVLRVSAFATDCPEVAEMDLNPVMAGPHGAVVVDAKLRLCPPVPVPDDLLPSLRA
jgi:acyl-CoA synthetase (NDP forming)